MTKTCKKRRRRCGAAVAELAICIPALVVLVMGAIECCTMIFVKQSLHVSAYEAARLAIKPDSNNIKVLNRCHQVLAERDIVDPDIQFAPLDVDNLDRGTPVTVRVTAPCASNSVLQARFFTGTLEAEVVMNKE